MKGVERGQVERNPPSPGGDHPTKLGEWLRRIARGTRAGSTSPAGIAGEGVDLRAAMLALNGTHALPPPLPNGVVELVVDDLGEAGSELFDIHDSRVAAIPPGSCVPWTSIAGSLAAWTLALGPERDPCRLRLTGEEALARAVLAALAAR